MHLSVLLICDTMGEETGSVDESARLLKDDLVTNRSPYNAFNASSGRQHSPSESSESVIDGEELQYDLARVNSHPTGLGVESSTEENRALRSKGYGTVGAQRSMSQEQVTGQDAAGSSPANPDDAAETDPKFIGVSRGRFWLVFGGILFAYFVRIHLIKGASTQG